MFNSTHRAHWLAGASALVLAGLAGAASAQAPADPAGAAEGGSQAVAGRSLDVITVTARRREESAQDIPVSVAAVGELELQRIGAESLADVVEQVANFSFLNQGSILGNFAIRGITNQFVVGESSAATVYVDGVLTGRSASFDTNLFGVKQVEVLRGPQGTFFGANTIAGAVNITTIRPGPEYGGQLKLEVGNYERAMAAGAVDVPINPDLLTRVTLSVEQQDGWIENLADDRNFNGENNWMGRFQALAYPTENLELYFTADRFFEQRDFVRQINDDPNDLKSNPDVDLADGIVDIDSPSTSDREIWGASLEANLDLDSDYTVTAIGAFRSNIVESLFDGDTTRQRLSDTKLDEDLEQWTAELRLTSPEYERFDFTIGGFWMNQTQDSEAQTRFFPKDILAGCQAGVTTSTFRGFPPPPPFENTSRIAGFDENGLPVWDFDLNADGIFNNPATNVFGFNEANVGCHNPDLIAFGRHLPGGQAEDFFLPFGFESVLGPVTAADVPDIARVSEFGTLETDSFSLFFHGNYHITEELTFTAGIRQTWEDKDLDMTQLGMINILRPSFTAQDSRSDSELSGTASLTWRPTEDITTYVKYARGFRSGGFNFDITQGENVTAFQQFILGRTGGVPNLAIVSGDLAGQLGRAPTKQELIDEIIARSADPNEAPNNIAFDPETVDVYEAGIKTSFLDDRVRVNLAGYYTDYQDRQQGVTRLTTGIVVLNVPESTVWGLEGDFQAAVNDYLTIYGGIGTAFSEIKSAVEIDNPQSGTGVELVGQEFIGQRLALAPEWTGNAGFTWDYPMFENGNLVIRGDYSYTGSILHELTEQDSALEDVVLEDEYHLFKARIGYVSNTNDWEIFLWGENLFDERYASFRRFNPIIRNFGIDQNGNGAGAFPGSGTAQAMFGPPRFYGVTFQSRF